MSPEPLLLCGFLAITACYILLVVMGTIKLTIKTSTM